MLTCRDPVPYCWKWKGTPVKAGVADPPKPPTCKPTMTRTTQTTSATAFAGFAVQREGQTIATLTAAVSKGTADRLAAELQGESFAVYRIA